MSPTAAEPSFLEPGKAADVRDRLISGDYAALIAAGFQLLADPGRLQIVHALLRRASFASATWPEWSARRSQLAGRVNSIPGVLDVHDLHMWTLTSEMDVATLHLVTKEETDPHPVLDRARELLQHEYGIAHATLQVEPDTHSGCAEVTW